MKLERVLRRIYCQEWAITEPMFDQIARIVEAHVLGTADHAAINLQFGDQEEVKPDVIGTTAIIPVKGVIGKGVSKIEKSSGMADVDSIEEMLQWAEEDKEIESVVLDFDSPGGTVAGVPELASRVASLGKPAISFTDAQCDSAAYWIASQARAFYAAPSANVGSIGVYLPIMDSSRRAQMEGMEPEIIKSGKYKGAGHPGTKLTPEQRDLFRDRVKMLHDTFKAAVRAGRGEVSDAAMEGQDFFSSEALEANLIDRIGTINDAIKEAQEQAKLRR